MASKHHEIEITIVGKGVFPPNPMPDITKDDTVRYVCKSDGVLTIAFPELSPFEPDAQKNDTRISGEKELKALNSGTFKSGCRFKPTGASDDIGWPADPAAGADVVIKP